MKLKNFKKKIKYRYKKEKSNGDLKELIGHGNMIKFDEIIVASDKESIDKLFSMACHLITKYKMRYHPEHYGIG